MVKMYCMKTNNKTLSTTLIILFILGIIFLLFGIISGIQSLEILVKGRFIEGRIDRILDNSIIVVYFIDNEVIYQIIYETSLFFYKGKELTLCYFNNKVYTYSGLFVTMSMLILIGIGLLIFPTLNFYKNYKYKILYNSKESLLKKEAKVLLIEKVRKFSVNGRHPYILACKVNYEGKEIIVKSKYIWEDVEYKEGYIVNIYFKNKNEYFIDLDSYREGIYFEEW